MKAELKCIRSVCVHGVLFLLKLLILSSMTAVQLTVVTLTQSVSVQMHYK